MKPLIIIGVVLAVVVGIWWQTRPEPIQVSLVEIETGRVEATIANTRAGTVKACRRARISPAIGGQIKTLNVREGDLVEKGQLLLELWNKDIHSQVELTKSELTRQKAQEQEICINAAVAEREVERLRPLSSRGMVSSGEIDIARTKAHAAQASCKAARVAIEVAQKRIEVARVQFERSQLVAPFSGIVAEVNGEVGEFLTPSPPGIATPPAIDLIDNSCLFVSAPIDEVDAAQVKVGQIARITLDAFRDRAFPAVVKRIAPYVVDSEKQARTIEIEVEFASEATGNSVLLPGYSADVEVILESRENAQRIPSEILQEDDYIYVVEAGKAVKRQLQIGLRNWKFAEVLGGIDSSAKIIHNLDAESLAPDVAVLIESESTSDSSGKH